jgi:RNase P/RNase MRP subunit p30
VKNFVDLVKPQDFNIENLNRYILRSIWLGNRGLLFEVPPSQLKILKAYKSQFVESCLSLLVNEVATLTPQQQGLIRQKLQDFNIWPCLVIKAEKSKREVKSTLASWRRSYPVICVTCNSADMTKWAVQDNRVDGILFPLKIGSRLFDNATARMCNENNKFLLISLSDFLRIYNKRVQFVRDIRKMLFYAKKKDCKVVYCTRADNVNYLRAAKEMAGLLGELGDQSVDKITTSLNTTLFEVVTRNLYKNSPAYLGPGVEIFQVEPAKSDKNELEDN